MREAGLEVRDVADLTGSPEILDGRVKTLHPRLHAALLAVRDDPDHMATLEAEGIEPIDLVCVNLYPFERTVSQPEVSEAEAVENIDIGGPTMIRAAAKNHRFVAVVVQPESYDAVLAELEDSDGRISSETRHWLANEAFAFTARYDAAISRWYGLRYEAYPSHWVMPHEKFLDLSYGENPHQKAALYVEVGARTHVLSRVAKLHGRALSFNNVLDLDVARRLVDELEPAACVIVKHNNPCGVAVAEQIGDAYEKALACDPMSAFGGVIALNRSVDRALAERLHERFMEVLIAPAYDQDALEVLKQKEAVRLLEATEQRGYEPRERDVKRVRGGLLVQDPDRIDESRESMRVVTAVKPEEGQWEDLLVRMEGVPPRALERDRDRQGWGNGGDRRGADEPRGFGEDRDRQGVPGSPRGCRGAAGGVGGGFRRVLPVFRWASAGDRRRGDGADPARRVDARLGGDRRLRRGGRGDGVHRAQALQTLVAGGATAHVPRRKLASDGKATVPPEPCSLVVTVLTGGRSKRWFCGRLLICINAGSIPVAPMSTARR